MRQSRAFTLVEILIVVVILGVLAAIVIPNVASASTHAVRSHLGRNLQQIDSQIEIYRANTAGKLPTEDPDDPIGEGLNNNGWGVMVSADYLKDEPMNFFTSSSLLAEGDEPTAIAAGTDDVNGWYFEGVGSTIHVYAAGYDRANNMLSTEAP